VGLRFTSARESVKCAVYPVPAGPRDTPGAPGALSKLDGTTMVSIRLSRAGAKKTPFYHLVVSDSRNRRDGRYIERLGFYNPVARGQEQHLKIDLERVDHWLSVGARPTERVAALIKASRKAARTTAA